MGLHTINCPASARSYVGSIAGFLTLADKFDHQKAAHKEHAEQND